MSTQNNIRSKKLLAIGSVWPEPNSSAAGQQFLTILQLFQSFGWEVVFATSATPSDWSNDLSEFHIETHPIRLNCDLFDQFVLAQKPHAVLYDRFMTEEQFGWRVTKNCPEALTILDTEDLQSLRYARQQAYKRKEPVLLNDLHSEIALREIAAIFRCDVSLIISDFEMEHLQKVYQVPQPILHYLPFLVKENELSSNTSSYSQRSHFISIGNFRHAPNWDSVLKLSELWPSIKAQCPQAECRVYGSYVPPKAQQLHNPKIGFLIKGRADDVKPLMNDARVLLAPLQFGAGIKGKLLDAMLADLPSVTTAIGAEGMTQFNQWPGVVAHNDQEFIEAAIKLYNNESIWQQKAQSCQPVLLERFLHSKFAHKFSRKVDEIMSDLSAHRNQNFVGKLLNFHGHRSTEYMSRWIVAKNKLAELRSNHMNNEI